MAEAEQGIEVGTPNQAALLWCETCRRPTVATSVSLHPTDHGVLRVSWLGLACVTCWCLHPATVKVVIHDGAYHSSAEVQQNTATAEEG